MTKKPATLATTLGHAPRQHEGAVNVPPYHTSTILFGSYEEYREAEQGKRGTATYGRYGSPTTRALEEAIAGLEGAKHCTLTSSGVSAVTTALMSFLEAGDHALIADTVYGPTRAFCDKKLRKLGVEIEYYDPMVGKDITGLMKKNTKLVFVESPGSLTFEVQDVPAIAGAAHAKGAIVVGDNTWGSPTLWRPFELGIDVSVISATKYIAGHSDLTMGSISAVDEKLFRQVMAAHKVIGACTNGADAYLALRGLRTIEARLKQHETSALKVAAWLEKRKEVQKLLHPAFESCPGHEFFTRDFKGSNGLFSFLVGEWPEKVISSFFNSFEVFGMGYSWGGYESLAIPVYPGIVRSARKWEHKGHIIRLHIGLEDVDDLIADLDKAFAAMNKAMRSAA